MTMLLLDRSSTKDISPVLRDFLHITRQSLVTFAAIKVQSDKGQTAMPSETSVPSKVLVVFFPEHFAKFLGKSPNKLSNKSSIEGDIAAMLFPEPSSKELQIMIGNIA